MDKLKTYADSFIKKFDSCKDTMRDIVKGFRKIDKKVRKIQIERRGGVFLAAAWCGLGVVGAVFTTGAALAITAVGASAIGTALERKTYKQKEIVCKVEKLRKDFMEIVEALKNDLKEIKRRCEMLKYDRQASKVEGRIEEVLDDVSAMMNFIRFTLIPEKNKKLREYVIQAADRCQKVVDKFDLMILWNKLHSCCCC